MSNGTVGIVIPVYNTDGAFIEECLRSALAQTLFSAVIVVDDGSTSADTLAAVDRCEAQGARVIRHPENRGVSEAWNTGIAAHSTDYILALGSDDRIRENFCELVASVLDSDESIGVVSTDLRHFGAFEFVEVLPDIRGVADLLYANRIPGGSMFRRSDWEAVGGFSSDLRYGEDWDLWVRILARGRSAVTVHEPLYEYRRHSGQSIKTTSSHTRLAQNVELVRRNHQIWADNVEAIMSRYWTLVDEHDSQNARLRAFERRYGALNKTLKSAVGFLRSVPRRRQ